MNPDDHIGIDDAVGDGGNVPLHDGSVSMDDAGELGPLGAYVPNHNDDVVPNHGVLRHLQLADKHLQLTSQHQSHGQVLLRQCR